MLRVVRGDEHRKLFRLAAARPLGGLREPSVRERPPSVWVRHDLQVLARHRAPVTTGKRKARDGVRGDAPPEVQHDESMPLSERPELLVWAAP